MNRMSSKRSTALLLIVLMGATVATARCAEFRRIGGTLGGIFTPNRQNDFAEANLRLKNEIEAPYTKARLVVVDQDGTPRTGVLTAAQYREFQALEQNVIDATAPVYEDVLEWMRTNTKPASYEAREKTLRAATAKLIAYVNTQAVKP